MAWVAGYMLTWNVRPKTVIHTGTNRARRGVTSLPLRQMATLILETNYTADYDHPEIREIRPYMQPVLRFVKF